MHIYCATIVDKQPKQNNYSRYKATIVHVYDNVKQESSNFTPTQISSDAHQNHTTVKCHHNHDQSIGNYKGFNNLLLALGIDDKAVERGSQQSKEKQIERG